MDLRLRALERDQSMEGWYALLQFRVRMGLEPLGKKHGPPCITTKIPCPSDNLCGAHLDMSSCPYCASCCCCYPVICTEVTPRAFRRYVLEGKFGLGVVSDHGTAMVGIPTQLLS